MFCVWGYSVSKRIAEADNPTAAMLEMMLRLDPTTEESPDGDGGAGTKIFRDWFGNEIRIQSLPGTDGPVTIGSGDGTTSIGSSGGVVEVPTWLAEYPGTKTAVRGFSSISNGTRVGMYSFVADDTHDALAFYRHQITTLGMTPESRTYSFGKNTFETIKGRSRGYELSVTASKSDRRSQVAVTYSGPAE